MSIRVISKSPTDSRQMISCHILDDFPYSQNRSVVLGLGLKLPLITSITEPRWNFRKANWTEFSMELDHLLQWIPAKADNYERFVRVIKLVAKKYIPRGFRQFIPGWSVICNELFSEFQKTKYNSVADELINKLNSKRRQRWREKRKT